MLRRTHGRINYSTPQLELGDQKGRSGNDIFDINHGNFGYLFVKFQVSMFGTHNLECTYHVEPHRISRWVDNI